MAPIRYLVLLCALSSAAWTQTALRFEIPLTSLTANNTSVPSDAVSRAANKAAGNATAANVSKLDVHGLLPEFKGLVFAHYMPWWGHSKHINIGMDEHNPALLRAQVEDMISRGFDGVVVTEANSGDFNTRTTELLFAEVQKHPGFGFAVCYTKWGLSTTDALVATLQKDSRRYFASTNYLKLNGRPVVFFFDHPEPINFAAAKQALPQPPAFIFRNPGGFSIPGADGAFAWLPDANDPGGENYFNKFHRAMKDAGGGKFAVGSVYKGFDDRLASWSKHKIIPQDCGRTLLASANRTPPSMNMVQVTTWNDYEEGTAVEPGVDNCGSLQISVSGDKLKLQPDFEQNGTEDTVGQYDVYIARAGSTQLAKLAKGLRPGTRTVDLKAFNLPPGNYTIYVQMVGKPLFQNRLSNPAIWNHP